jgi:GH15 family glucan-1,4-alpha-glucosidase
MDREERDQIEADNHVVTDPVKLPRPPSIEDYALIGDCHGSALVSRDGSIDWCCIPRPDSGSCFSRLLDGDRGGSWQISPDSECEISRRYLDDTLVLETTFHTEEGTVRLIDYMAMPVQGDRHRIVRVLEGVDGSVPIRVTLSPRLEYGALKPWIRSHDGGVFSAIGGTTGLVFSGTIDLRREDRHDLRGEVLVSEGDRHILCATYAPPDRIDPDPPDTLIVTDFSTLDETITWWRDWVGGAGSPGPAADARRSGIVLKALSYAPTGAFVAAPTTSLPESVGGERNWDYRYSWVRDSTFAARALIELGFEDAATEFRRFVERSAAGSADELQPMYGVGGEIRIPELEIGYLNGYRGSRPVRIGNAAFPQRQLDLYGYLLDLAWRWQRQGVTPSLPYWEFLSELVDTACERWTQPDRGIWEVRGDPEHFVHSKVMCWSAVDCGLRLAEKLDLEAPVERWKETRQAIRHSIESRGFDTERGIYVRAYDRGDLDAALLLLPWVGFVGFDDERMIRTADEIQSTLGHRGLIRRYTAADGLEGEEGTFIACTFWLAECLARQGRLDEAHAVFDRAVATGNDLGLFSEEYDPARGEMLGNFPQAMTHFSHITALCAIEEVEAAL